MGITLFMQPYIAGFQQTPVTPDTKSVQKTSDDSKQTQQETKQGQNPATTDRLTLSKEALQLLQKLQARDREVRAHEHAHMVAGGPYVRGGPSYTYKTGPDGKRYAVGGEVQIDTSPEKDPEATIRKMETVKRAALAPAKPSSQDRMVAARASMEEQKARMELMEQKREEEVSSLQKGNKVAGDSPKEGPLEGKGSFMDITG